jgi:glycosyltransferase involved in cell wall biosynthesis
VAPNAGTVRRSLNYLSFGVTSVLSSLPVKDADVVIASTPQFFAGLAGTVVRRLKRLPLLLEVRDLWPDSLDAVEVGAGGALMGVLRRIERFMYRAAAHIVIVSPAFRAHIEATGIEGEKISVVPNGVSTEMFGVEEEEKPQRDTEGHRGKESEEEKEKPRRDTEGHRGKETEEEEEEPRRDTEGQRGISSEEEIDRETGVLPGGLQGKFVAVYVGTHGMAHALETVVDAARLLGDDPSIHILFVGEGARKQAVMAYAAGLPNVTFLDRMPRERIAALLSEVQAGIVVLRRTPLFRTVIPSKMFEMMGAGLPVVLGVEGQAREILEEADGGIAVEPENAEALAGAIRKLKNDTALRERCGKNASLHVRKKYDLDVLAAQYLEVISTRCAAR